MSDDRTADTIAPIESHRRHPAWDESSPLEDRYETSPKMTGDSWVFGFLEQNPPTIRIVRPGVALIESINGTIVVGYGDEGVALVDCYYPHMAEKVVELVRTVTDAPLKYAIPTHFHHDHSGGASHFASLGAVIVGKESARERMCHDYHATHLGSLVAAAPESRPTLTYDTEVVLHLNGEEIEIVYTGPAHTDTDSVVRFRKANVIHLGDIFVEYPYPYLDLGSGADSQGMLAAVERVLDVADRDTIIIPGHGAPQTYDDLGRHAQLLRDAHDGVRARLAGGMSREQILAEAKDILVAHPVEQALIEPEVFISDVHRSLTAAR